jgi:hypothetical protein
MGGCISSSKGDSKEDISNSHLPRKKYDTSQSSTPQPIVEKPKSVT